MSLREMAYEIINNFTEQQLKGFIMLFGSLNNDFTDDLNDGEEDASENNVD